MKNWLGYLYNRKGIEEIKQDEERVSLSYQQLKEFQTRLKGIEQYFQKVDRNSDLQEKVAALDDVIGTIQGLLQLIGTIKSSLNEEQAKLSEYDRLKNKVENHHNIVDSMRDGYEKQINGIYDEKHKLDQQLKQDSDNFSNTNRQIAQELGKFRETHEELVLANQTLKTRNQELQQDMEKLKVQHTKATVSLQNLLLFRKNTKPKIVSLDKITLTQVLYYKKLRVGILKFLDFKDIYRLSAIDRETHIIVDHSIKTEVIANIQTRHKKEIGKARDDVQFYQKIYQQFAEEKIRQNAIKYLFFKIKPGMYMLPLFQQDFNKIIESASSPTQIEDTEAPETAKNSKEQSQQTGTNNRSIRGAFKSFFTTSSPLKVKQQDNSKATHKFSLTMLKDHKQFRMVEKKIEDYFQKIFEMKFPTDLENFMIMMKEQLNQLKTGLGEHNKAHEQLSELYCFSKFLYLEANEMSNLLQMCFGLLIKSDTRARSLESAIESKLENQKAMRGLVEELMHDKNNMEKRIWTVENDILNYREDSRKATLAISQLQRQIEVSGAQLQSTRQELDSCKEHCEGLRKRKKELEGNVSLVKEELKEWFKQNP